MEWQGYSGSIQSTSMAAHDVARAEIVALLRGPLNASGVISAPGEQATQAGRIEKNSYHDGGLLYLLKRDGRVAGIAESVFDAILPIKLALIDYIGRFTGHPPGAYTIDSAWVVCQRSGDYGPIHHHGDCDYAGIWYLDCPASINDATYPDGHLYLVDGTSIHHIAPMPGTLVIWPADRLHGVYPFRGEGDRLAVSFNVKRRRL